MNEINIIVRPTIGFEEQRCQGCGTLFRNGIELHLRYAVMKVSLCETCDQAQLGKPRMVRDG